MGFSLLPLLVAGTSTLVTAATALDETFFCNTGHDKWGDPNPCKVDQYYRDFCCDDNCQYCGPEYYCKRQSPVTRNSIGECNPNNPNPVCVNYWQPCEGWRVSFFYNSDFIDQWDSDKMRDALRGWGVVVNRFTTVTSPVGWVDDVLVVPPLKSGQLGSAMSESVKTALRISVWSGSLLIIGHLGFDAVNGTCGSRCRGVEWLNGLFGWSLDGGNTTCNRSGAWTRTPSAEVMPGSSRIPVLQEISSTLAVRSSSLPEGSEVLYELGDCASVAAIPYGSGTVVTLGYDYRYWGIDDWSEVLMGAVRTRGNLSISVQTSTSTTTTLPPSPTTVACPTQADSVGSVSQAGPLCHTAAPLLTSLLALLVYA